MVRRFEIWLADLNPRVGTEPGKTRPVIVVQTDLLNVASHPSTIVCPITSKVEARSKLVRLHLPARSCGLDYESDAMLDQIRAIDNRRFLSKLGSLSSEQARLIRELLRDILDID